MNWIHYIDNEVPNFGDWTGQTEEGSSTIVEAAAAAWPERGSIGLRVTIVGGAGAYVTKDVSITLDPAGSVYVGLWLRLNGSWPGGTAEIAHLKNELGSYIVILNLDASGCVSVRVYQDGTGSFISTASSNSLIVDRWHYLTLRLKRASTNVAADGSGGVYVDGQLWSSRYDVDNYDRAVDVGSILMGGPGAVSDGDNFDFDEIKIATSYAEPYVPTPGTSYVEAARTVLLYRLGSADSIAFADYCVEKLGIPRGNLCPLPSASADESLADYAAFQAQVENDLASWLSLNATVDANKMCFLIGYGVPGYFTDGGVKHSAVNRLMNYGNAFSSHQQNPLWNPSTVRRISKADLTAAGVFLAGRIDADMLQHAKDILDCGLQIADCGLQDTDVLFSDDSTYLASLSCQKLRIRTNGSLAVPGGFADDGFIWGDTGDPSFSTGGSRAAFCDDTASSASTLRAATDACGKALITAGYAAALGFAESISGLAMQPFLEMLRIGGTFAEAAGVAIGAIDYTAVAAGVPMMTAAFELGGYNFYRGVAVRAAIDYTTLVACCRPGTIAPTFAGLCPVEDVDYWFAVRSLSSKGVEEMNTARIVSARIEAGQLVTGAPNAIERTNASAEAAAGGKIRLRCYYSARGETGKATAIQVARASPTPDGIVIDWLSLIQTIAGKGTRQIDKLLDPTFEHGEMVQLAVRAVTASGTPGEHAVLDPIAADAVPPAAVTYVEASQA